MAGIRRFITYIYAYEDGKKAANTGFAKIEVRGNECRIEAHVSGAPQRQGTCGIYIFKEEDGKMLAFPLGELEMRNGSGTYGTVIKADRIGGSEYGFSQMDGLVFADGAGSVCMTRWTEGAPVRVAQESIRVWEPLRFEEKESLAEKGTTAAQTIAQSAPRKAELPENTVSEAQPIAHETAQAQSDTAPLHATELPARNIFPKYSVADTWERMKDARTHFAVCREAADCLRIELKDLRELPGKYWYLGNNSFLLHGFFNYRHLAFGQADGEQWFLGVPGVYQQQERVMAAIFGFAGFFAVEECGASDDAAPGEPVNRFGYWYHWL